MPSVDPHIPVTRAPIRSQRAADSLDTIAFGEWLRTAREESGITLEQIARETKIRPLHLDALEHGRLAELPAGAYRRGETIAYAKAIGMDPMVALQHLEEALQGAQSSTAATVRRRSLESPRVRRASTLLSLLVLAVSVAGIVLWTSTSSTPDENPSRGVAPPSPDPAAVPAVQPPSPAPTSSSHPRDAPAARTDAAQAQTPAPSTKQSAATAGAAPGQPDLGRLTIVTDPPGARVTLNGIGRGSTPLTLADLSAGALRIRVTKDGRTAQERDVQFTGRSMMVKISLPERQP
jgi:cytoskeletal protein RodZ